MRKISFLVILFSLLLPSASVYSEEFKIGTDNWFPYNRITDIKNPGFSTEILDEVFRNMDIKYSIIEYPWRRGIYNVFQGEIDALCTAFYTPERGRYCYYPVEPFITTEMYLFVKAENKESLGYKSEADLENRIVGVVSGYGYPEHYIDYIRTHGTLDYSKDEETMVRKLLNSRIDCFIMSKHRSDCFLSEEEFRDKVVRAGNALSREGLYMIFSKITVDLLFVARFSEELGEFKKSEKYKRLFEKYFKTVNPE